MDLDYNFYCRESTKDQPQLNRLFDKIPEELFAPLSRKYKTVYAFSLITLYHLLRSQKTDVRRSDFALSLKSQGEERRKLFNIEADRLDDKDEEESVDVEQVKDKDDEAALLSQKVSYIIRKLSKCGWYIISRNPKTNVEYLYLPSFSIQRLKLLNDLACDTSSYLPLVHQTYAELKREDEKEDDYRYRSLENAKNNADTLDRSVTLLRQQILVYGNRLSKVFDPNTALKQHFDEYREDIADKYYHPRKTYDSLGLYAQPTISILKKWIKSERIITRLVRQAKAEPGNNEKDLGKLTSSVIKKIQDIIDIFSRLSSAFDEIDHANADYTEAVQRKVNYLSSSDKTRKGKLTAIVRSLAGEISKNPALSYDERPLLAKAGETISLYRQGYLDSQSRRMPYKRTRDRGREDPLPLEDDLLPEESSLLRNNILDNELNRFSDTTIRQYLEDNLEGKEERLTNERKVESTDDLVRRILGILKARLGRIPYTAEKISDRVLYAGYYRPLYRFKKKGVTKHVSRGL